MSGIGFRPAVWGRGMHDGGARARAGRVMVMVSVAVSLLAVSLLTGRAEAVPVPVADAPVGGGATTTETVRVGPIHLEAAPSMFATDSQYQLIPRPSGHYGIKALAFDLVDLNDQPVDRHEVRENYFVMAKVFGENNACPGQLASGAHVTPFAGTGVEHTPISFPDPYALLVADADIWGASWSVQNTTASPRDVYLRYTITYQVGATATNTRALVPYLADATGCPGSLFYDVPGNGGSGSTDVRSVSFTMPSAGIVVTAGGHVDEGGIATVLRHGTGAEICRATPTFDGQGRLDAISSCAPHDTVAAGESLRLDAVYDNASAHAHVLGFGLAYVWFGVQPSTATSSTTSTTTTTTMPITTVAATTATAVAATPTYAG